MEWCEGFKFRDLGFRVSGFGFRVWDLGFRVQGFGFRVVQWCQGFRTDSGFGGAGAALVLGPSSRV